MTDETNIPDDSYDAAADRFKAAADSYDPADTYAKYRQQEAERKSSAEAKLKSILALFREHNVVSFGMVYSGESDSGCLDTASLFNRTFSAEELHEVEYEEADGDKELEIQRALVNQNSQDFLDDLADTLMDMLVPPGYEINDGGQGVIVLNVASGEVIGEHGSNYVQVDTTSLEINLDTETSDEV
jgi:hypothetical protein